VDGKVEKRDQNVDSIWIRRLSRGGKLFFRRAEIFRVLVSLPSLVRRD